MEHRSKEKIVTLEVYTDGALKKVGQYLKYGGWGFIIIRDGRIVYYDSGSEYGTTNQRMELTAIYKALEIASKYRTPTERVVVYSDSAYAINCYLQDWYITWQRNGWTNYHGQPVANIDLWQKIIPYFDNYWYTFKKVQGHSGVIWNEKCDKLASSEADKLKQTYRGNK